MYVLPSNVPGDRRPSSRSSYSCRRLWAVYLQPQKFPKKRYGRFGNRMFSQRCWKSLARPYRRCGKYSLMNVISISPRKSARPPDAVWSPLWSSMSTASVRPCWQTSLWRSSAWRRCHPHPSYGVGWAGIPALIVGSLFGIAWQKGAVVAGSNALFWILATGIPCALGALCALAHPVTVVTAFLAAPITTLLPVIGAAMSPPLSRPISGPPGA